MSREDWERANDAAASIPELSDWLYDSGVDSPEDIYSARVGWDDDGYGHLYIETGDSIIEHNFGDEGMDPHELPGWIMDDLYYLLDAYEVDLDIEDYEDS